MGGDPHLEPQNTPVSTSYLWLTRQVLKSAMFIMSAFKKAHSLILLKRIVMLVYAVIINSNTVVRIAVPMQKAC